MDTSIRLAAFEHARRLNEAHDHLTVKKLKPGFVFDGERIPLVNPQRGIFKPSLNNHGLWAGDSLQCHSGTIRAYMAHFCPFVSYVVCYLQRGSLYYNRFVVAIQARERTANSHVCP